jgi:hypothetical protein
MPGSTGRQGERCEDVGLELGANALARNRLDRPGPAVARVVDQHADGALRLPDGVDGRAPRGVIDDV